MRTLSKGRCLYRPCNGARRRIGCAAVSSDEPIVVAGAVTNDQVTVVVAR